MDENPNPEMSSGLLGAEACFIFVKLTGPKQIPFANE